MSHPRPRFIPRCKGSSSSAGGSSSSGGGMWVPQIRNHPNSDGKRNMDKHEPVTVPSHQVRYEENEDTDDGENDSGTEDEEIDQDTDDEDNEDTDDEDNEDTDDCFNENEFKLSLDNFVKAQIEKCNCFNDTFTYFSKEDMDEILSGSEFIGSGGEGEVYRVEMDNMTVAVKIPFHRTPAQEKAFNQEVNILKEIKHPNVVTLIGACTELHALIYEFLPKHSLKDFLQETEPIKPMGERLEVAKSICAALVKLHSMKPFPVVHGDLKPENILFDSKYVCKLIDFGSSRLLNQQESEDDMLQFYNMTRNNFGTAYYVDPEALKNKRLTCDSDIFSFGIILLQLLTRMTVDNYDEAHEKWHLLRDNKGQVRGTVLREIVMSDELYRESKKINTYVDLLQLAMDCSNPTSASRPSASKIWWLLDKLTK